MLRILVLGAAMAIFAFALLYLFVPLFADPQIIDLVTYRDVRAQREISHSTPDKLVSKGEKLKVTGCYFDKSSTFYARVQLRDGETAYVELVDGLVALDRRPATPKDIIRFWHIVWTCGDPYFARPELQLRSPTANPG